MTSHVVHCGSFASSLVTGVLILKVVQVLIFTSGVGVELSYWWSCGYLPVVGVLTSTSDGGVDLYQ